MNPNQEQQRHTCMHHKEKNKLNTHDRQLMSGTNTQNDENITDPPRRESEYAPIGISPWLRQEPIADVGAPSFSALPSALPRALMARSSMDADLSCRAFNLMQQASRSREHGQQYRGCPPFLNLRPSGLSRSLWSRPRPP